MPEHKQAKGYWLDRHGKTAHQIPGGLNSHETWAFLGLERSSRTAGSMKCLK